MVALLLFLYTFFWIAYSWEQGINGDMLDSEYDWIYKLLNFAGVLLTWPCAYCWWVKYFLIGVGLFNIALVIKLTKQDKDLQDYYK